MRSSTLSGPSEMSWTWCLSLSLGFLQIVGSSGNRIDCLALQQPEKVVWRDRGQAASLHCIPNCVFPAISFSWFVYKAHSYHELKFAAPEFARFHQSESTLHIYPLLANDSGIYYCAAVHAGALTASAQQFGPGTTLVVKGEVMLVSCILLWLLVCLLSISTLALIVLFVRQKTGHHVNCRPYVRSHKAECDQSNHSHDDIYQNL